MSCTEIVAFKKDGKATYYGETGNAWRGAIRVWNVMSEKYLGGRCNVLFNPIPVFDLYKNEKLTREDKIVLGATFDKVIIGKDTLSEVITAFRNFDKCNGGSSLDEQADMMQEILDDEDYIGVAFNQNSVVENRWIGSSYDDETDEEIEMNYNMLTDNEHFMLIEDINKMEGSKC